MIILKQKLLNIGLVRDNVYLDKYVELIINNSNTPHIKYKTQKHHIIPRHYYEHNGLPVDNTKHNTVELLYSDHILAHYYLYKCSANDFFVGCNCSALRRMVGKKPTDIKVSDETFFEDYNSIYEISTKVCSEINHQRMMERYSNLDIEDLIDYYTQKGNTITDCERKYNIPHRRIKQFLLDNNVTLKSASEIKLYLGDEVRVKLSMAHKGTVHIHRDNIEKVVPKELVEEYIANGWSLGRSESNKTSISIGSVGKVGAFKGKHHSQEFKDNLSKQLSGRKYMFKGEDVKAVKLEEVEQLLTRAINLVIQMLIKGGVGRG